MASLIDGTLTAALHSQKQMFDRHLSPWMGRLFADLEVVERADFYRRVGRLGRLFIEIETEGFARLA